MKILFFRWHSFMNRGIERALKKLDIEYKTFDYQFTDWENDDIFLEKFRNCLVNHSFDTILSVNFSPLISQVCLELERNYISWVYDSPLHIRDLEPLKNPCNQIYMFDRGMAEIYRDMGANIYHMPLAADTESFAEAIHKTDKSQYAVDVSMVGNLYHTDYQYFLGPMDEYIRGYLEGIINSQSKVYGGYLIPELIQGDLLERMNILYQKASAGSFSMGKRELEQMLACEVTGRERYVALALLSEYFSVDLYSVKEDKRLLNVNYKGYADYYSVMPAVFAASKINLNIGLWSIRTGIPLRVIDIMGCGGFVLTSYKEEIVEYFIPGEECVIYEGLEDLYQKASFYLTHETERQHVAQAGFDKVKRDFTFEQRLGEMLLK